MKKNFNYKFFIKILKFLDINTINFLNATNENFLQGHWNAYAGVIYHNGWIFPSNSFSTTYVSPNTSWTFTAATVTSGIKILTLVVTKFCIIPVISSVIPSNNTVFKSHPNSGLYILSPLLVNNKLIKLDLI